jgi:hypothetical protein
MYVDVCYTDVRLEAKEGRAPLLRHIFSSLVSSIRQKTVPSPSLFRYLSLSLSSFISLSLALCVHLCVRMSVCQWVSYSTSTQLLCHTAE